MPACLPVAKMNDGCLIVLAGLPLRCQVSTRFFASNRLPRPTVPVCWPVGQALQRLRISQQQALRHRSALRSRRASHLPRKKLTPLTASHGIGHLPAEAGQQCGFHAAFLPYLPQSRLTFALPGLQAVFRQAALCGLFHHQYTPPALIRFGEQNNAAVCGFHRVKTSAASDTTPRRRGWTGRRPH